MDKNTKIIVLCITIFILNISLLLFIIFQPRNKVQETPNYLKTIDSLELVINKYQLINDSLLQKINNSKQSIIYINKIYEKDIEYINNNTVDENIMFFSDYLSKNNN